MNAAELAVHIAAERGITVALATHLLNDLASAAIGELQAGKQVTLPGIGVLKPDAAAAAVPHDRPDQGPDRGAAAAVGRAEIRAGLRGQAGALKP